ncbi:hypothetical protein EFO70_06720 [Lacticaseibacillus rhamnosus]|uniref:ABC transporter permease n=1 Tax=Lacticaseibacillus rhamnosus TaxID=47715 RepID=UPI00065ACE8F|nr:ABC transporter permease [Lacticaseibacillus rhamnosus]KMO49905.1 membrane protein [Lacticaseibacillus rhamnosus]MCT3173659.1 hypothetical protein [Lacticaseibacillus rhamnosus]MCT3181219.1 hypothetical protein [Lacticaseibacillus rhamnosus]OAU23534.1 membrane protein [Lacticaseibacillus rhamnosus]WHM91017.1 ABC transporter permease [Lacticaseibacillus rhamnosus]
MKKLFLIDLLWIGLAILAGLVWSQHDQNEYASQLDHLGMSETAQEYVTKSQRRVTTAVAELAKTDFSGYQVQFVSKQVVYVYQRGTVASLPVETGQWFSNGDFESSLPVTVVGHDLADKLYTGSNNQRYLSVNDQYVPVVGTVGTRKGSPLNKAVFLNASPNTANGGLRLKQVKVYVDGANQHGKVLKSILRANKVHRVHFSDSNAATWWRAYGQTALFCVLLLLGAGLLSVLMVVLIGPLQTSGLEINMRARYLRGVLSSCASHVGISLLFGGLFANWWFYYTTRASIWGFLIILTIATVVFLRYLIRRKDRTSATS